MKRCSYLVWGPWRWPRDWPARMEHRAAPRRECGCGDRAGRCGRLAAGRGTGATRQGRSRRPLDRIAGGRGRPPAGAGAGHDHGGVRVLPLEPIHPLQPRFTRPQWTAEVDKMHKTYGAPLTDPQAADAVNYLVAVRGREEPATKPAK